MATTKLQLLKDAMACGDHRKAISIASKFYDLGNAREAVTRAQGCFTNPKFYAQLGIDCQAAIQAGVDALRIRYELPTLEKSK